MFGRSWASWSRLMAQSLLEHFLGPQDGLQMDPVWDSFIAQLGEGFGIHFGVTLERLKYLGK